MKDISIVLVAFQAKKHLETCFTSLFQDIKNSPLDIHVVVVDNAANSDGIKEWLAKEYPKVEYIDAGGNIGFGKSQNIGIKSVRAKYYFCLNPDTEFIKDTNTINRLYEFMEKHSHVGMIGPKIQYPDGTLQHSCYRFPTFLQPVFSRTALGKKGKGKQIADQFFMKDFDHNQTMPVDWIMGSAMFVRKEAIDAVGMFDEQYFMYAEDADWCRRMWEAHWPVYYVHDIVLSHVHGRGSAKVPGVIKALVKNKLARVHLISWLKYMWKWKGNRKFYH